jgi:hypothetical protein
MAKPLCRSDRAVTTYCLPLDIMGLGANKGSLGPKYHVYTVDYYSSIDQGYPISIRGPPLEYPPQEWTMIS